MKKEEPRIGEEEIIVLKMDEVEIKEKDIKKSEIRKEEDIDEIRRKGKKAWITIQHWLETGELRT